ncbi:MAG: cyclic nucleotide-binding domain-containing protein, partial [Candidatus Scalindua sp.]|nr:cyclic nucleotide-binding domain-containing protein [Candidatus Scalindua sp.]
ELNQQFIEIYDLKEELSPDVPLEDITILKEETSIVNGELIFDQNEILSQFISYAVGCMFGRYSLDKEGLILANQGETLQDYLLKVEKEELELSFVPDDDNIIPILDDEWFEDDIVGRFYAFLKASFGEQNFERNLSFVEDSLGKDYKDGDTIFEENSIGKEMYIILSGNTEIIKKRGGVETTLATLEEGDFFGEMSLFDNSPRSATVKALGDVKLLEINQKNFLKKISRDPSLAFRMFEKMSLRIRTSDEKILNYIVEIKGLIDDHQVFI